MKIAAVRCVAPRFSSAANSVLIGSAVRLAANCTHGRHPAQTDGQILYTEGSIEETKHP